MRALAKPSIREVLRIITRELLWVLGCVVVLFGLAFNESGRLPRLGRMFAIDGGFGFLFIAAFYAAVLAIRVVIRLHALRRVNALKP